jgi:peptide/nickel transport system substrate-binding protein
MRLAIDLDPDTLDPAGQTNPTVSSIVDHMVETLVRLMPDGSIGPGLARKFTLTPDGRTYTFELRQDVEFHDGGLLNAEAVKQSLQRFSAFLCARPLTPIWSTASLPSTQ